jgi:hypothetical protein
MWWDDNRSLIAPLIGHWLPLSSLTSSFPATSTKRLDYQVPQAHRITESKQTPVQNCVSVSGNSLAVFKALRFSRVPCSLSLRYKICPRSWKRYASRDEGVRTGRLKEDSRIFNIPFGACTRIYVDTPVPITLPQGYPGSSSSSRKIESEGQWQQGIPHTLAYVWNGMWSCNR